MEDDKRKVFQFIYTKVSPEDSPWSKKDFHTLFYPINLMSKTDVFEVEKRIYFSQLGKFKGKETVFYQKIQGRDYLVILHIRNLPEERDIFGRAGIFLCHGFIFPDSLWRKFCTPLSVFNIVKDSLFKTRKEALSSLYVDKKTGDIKPIEILPGMLKCLSFNIPELSTEFEWKIVILLNRIAVAQEKRPILFKGKSDNVSVFINKLFAYVPDELKQTLGWDTAFDGGNLSFFPLPIVGYSNIAPTGNNPIKINLETLKIEDTTEVLRFFIPSTPYEMWLSHCRKDIVSKDHVEKAYRLSLILKTENHFSKEELLLHRNCFALVNKELIKDVFIERCERMLDEIITHKIAGRLTPDSMLDLIIENFPHVKLVKEIEDVVIKNIVTKESIKKPFPQFFINAGPRLMLIEMLWKGAPVSPDDLRALNRVEKKDFIRYILLTKWHEKDWVLDVLKENEEIFRELLSSYESGRVIERILLNLILKEKDFKDIGELLLREILYKKKECELLRKELNFLDILEESLREGIWDIGQIKTIISWAKKRKFYAKEYQYIRAFLYPGQGISPKILEHREIIETLTKCLIQYHGYTIRDLELIGFKKDDLLKVNNEIKNRGWIERTKKIFGLRGKK